MIKTHAGIAATLALPVVWSRQPPSNTGNQVSTDTNQLVETQDSDNDGVLSLAELHQHAKDKAQLTQFENMDSQETVELDQFENMDSQVSTDTTQLVDTLDSDNDGVLSLAEFNEHTEDNTHLKQFDNMDSQDEEEVCCIHTLNLRWQAERDRTTPPKYSQCARSVKTNPGQCPDPDESYVYDNQDEQEANACAGNKAMMENNDEVWTNDCVTYAMLKGTTTKSCNDTSRISFHQNKDGSTDYFSDADAQKICGTWLDEEENQGEFQLAEPPKEEKNKCCQKNIRLAWQGNGGEQYSASCAYIFARKTCEQDTSQSISIENQNRDQQRGNRAELTYQEVRYTNTFLYVVSRKSWSYTSDDCEGNVVKNIHGMDDDTWNDKDELFCRRWLAAR